LGAGIDFVRQKGIKAIRNYEDMLAARFISGAQKINDLKIFGTKGGIDRVPVVSFQLQGKDTASVGGALDRWYNIACRAGLHCAPDAHRTLGTFDQKLVRFSFSVFNKPDEVDYALQCLRDIKERELPDDIASGCNC